MPTSIDISALPAARYGWRATNVASLSENSPNYHLIAHYLIGADTLSASVAPFLRETGLPSLDKPFTPEEVLELVARIERL